MTVVLKRDRQVVERAFRLLKMKWRRLKFLDVFRLENAHTILMVTACLHNFGLEVDGWIDDDKYMRIMTTKKMRISSTMKKKKLIWASKREGG
jgi:hypothetical protein